MNYPERPLTKKTLVHGRALFKDKVHVTHTHKIKEKGKRWQARIEREEKNFLLPKEKK